MESRKMVTDEPICKAEIGIQTDRTNVWTPSGGRGMVGWDELGDWDRHIYPTAHKMGFPDGSAGKESISRRHRRLGFNPWIKKIPWRRKWQPIPLCLPGKSPWTERILAGCSPRGGKELDITEWLSTHMCLVRLFKFIHRNIDYLILLILYNVFS